MTECLCLDQLLVVNKNAYSLHLIQLAIVVKTIPLPNMPPDIDPRAYPFKVVDCLHPFTGW